MIIRNSSDFELVSEPSLALLVFRYKREHRTDPELNLLNQQLVSLLTVRSDVFLTQTMLHSVEGDIFCVRFAMGGVNTTMEDVLATWRVVEESARGL
jgi:aromatic-L-amino-acid decarboxylase